MQPTYAIIRTGAKQYLVRPGDVIQVEKLDGAENEPVIFSDVLAIGGAKKLEAGAPTVEGQAVHGTIYAQGRGDKIHVFKKRRRQNSRRSRGHRQYHTKVLIDRIGKA